MLDVGHLPREALEPLDNPVTAVFQLEQSLSLDDFRRVVRELVALLGQEEEFEAIRRDIASWLNRVILPARIPGQPIHEVRDLQEVDEMLAETVKTWPKQWMAEGLEKGRQEGRREGRLEVLQLLIENRFGSLSTEHRKRLEAADSDQLSSWATRIMSASSADEVFRE